MPTMTQTALSDRSYPESTAYSIRDEIDTTIARLKEVINEETSLRMTLRALFVRRKEEALEQVRAANQNLDLINAEEKAFCEDLKQAAATANKELNGTLEDDGKGQQTEPATCERACCPHASALADSIHAGKGMPSSCKRDEVAEDAEKAALRAEQELLDLLEEKPKRSKEGVVEKKKPGRPKKGGAKSVETKPTSGVQYALDKVIREICTDKYQRFTDNNEPGDPPVEEDDDWLTAAFGGTPVRTSPAANRPIKSEKADPSPWSPKNP